MNSSFSGWIPVATICLPLFCFGENWNQGAGPNFDHTVKESPRPLEWSASLGKNVKWRTELPETGQSTPVVWGDRVFLTMVKPVDEPVKTASDIVALCLSAETGEVLWQREIAGGYQTKISAPFGDASTPSAMTDGEKVWFLNPTGRVVCFDLDGNEIWSRAVTSCSRGQPILFEGKLIFHRQVYHPDEHGHFTHKNKDAPHEEWTQLQALNAETGEQVWLTECGVNMGCHPLVQFLDDGSAVLVVGRGGGHGPPEPEGVSMIHANDGATRWTLPIPGFMSTQTYPVVNGEVLIFHGSEHWWVDAESGKVNRKTSITKDVLVRRWTTEGRKTVTENLPSKKGRSITQGSNLRVGEYHYFRAYTANYLGRVNLKSGSVEYLELPLQLLREKGEQEQVLWNAEHRKEDLAAITKKGWKNNVSYTSLVPNRVKNARGIKVMGDDRAVGNGWGHTASPLATAFGNRLYVPILSGLVFVIHADAEVFDESAVHAVNDLGTLGDAYTRASISTDGTAIYGRTILEVIAFDE